MIVYVRHDNLCKMISILVCKVSPICYALCQSIKVAGIPTKKHLVWSDYGFFLNNYNGREGRHKFIFVKQK